MEKQTIAKMDFTDYYVTLDVREKALIRDQMFKYISHPSFYRKIRERSFSLLEIEKLEQITGKTFERCSLEM